MQNLKATVEHVQKVIEGEIARLDRSLDQYLKDEVSIDPVHILNRIAALNHLLPAHLRISVLPSNYEAHQLAKAKP